MRIVLPYTRLHPATARLANRYLPGHVRVPVGAGMDAYWRILAHEWRQPGDLVIVEHDIGVHARVLHEFSSCSQPWCGNPYPIAGQMLVCLGCTRFSADLKAALPDLLDQVGQVGNDGLPAKDWRRLDVRLADALEALGHRRHWHSPVKHYHRYP